MNRTYRVLPVLALAVAGVAGCADTEIQGTILEGDINTPELMIGVARGTNSEFTDHYSAVDIQATLDGATDGLLNDGTASGEIDIAVGDFRNRPISGLYASLLESSWAVFWGTKRMREVFGDSAYMVSPFVARNFVYGGHSERMLGEVFCELVYNFGKDGGIFLGQDGPYDNTRTVPNDSAFRRAIYMFETGLAHAQAAVAAQVAIPENDPLFDPARIVIAAHAGLAQAYMNLGDWTQAVAHARLVPDNFADIAAMAQEVDGGNEIEDWFHASDDMSIYRTPAHLLYSTDPRVMLVKCGDWRTTNRDNDASTPPASAFNNLSAACGHTGGEFRSESNRYPLYISDKYPDDGADVEIASGAEMRLIEAEAALVAGNLAEFTIQVNRARAARGVGPITQPATAGALEYPNAQNDGWSILDRERYLELFLEGRRFWDLRRWDHPFFTGNHVLVPRLTSQRNPAGRMKCFPIPVRECTVNSALACPVLS